jgi:hypothetical protein
MSGIRVCRFCGIKITLVSTVWLAAEVADVNGFCPNSEDDRHTPHVEAAQPLRQSSW